MREDRPPLASPTPLYHLIPPSPPLPLNRSFFHSPFPFLLSPPPPPPPSAADDNGLSGTVPPELGSLLLLESIELHGNAGLRGTVPPVLCDQAAPLGELTTLTADCGGPLPTVECGCCTGCRDGRGHDRIPPERDA